MSTYAEIMAVVEAHKDWNRVRDFFPSQNIALNLNHPKAEKQWTAEDILLLQYRARKKGVMITPHDPDHGALGGEEVKAALKAKTQAERLKKKKLKRYR